MSKRGHTYSDSDESARKKTKMESNCHSCDKPDASTRCVQCQNFACEHCMASFDSSTIAGKFITHNIGGRVCSACVCSWRLARCHNCLEWTILHSEAAKLNKTFCVCPGVFHCYDCIIDISNPCKRCAKKCPVCKRVTRSFGPCCNCEFVKVCHDCETKFCDNGGDTYSACSEECMKEFIETV